MILTTITMKAGTFHEGNVIRSCDLVVDQNSPNTLVKVRPASSIGASLQNDDRSLHTRWRMGARIPDIPSVRG